MTRFLVKTEILIRRPHSPLKGRGNSVKCLAHGHNKRTCRPSSTL